MEYLETHQCKIGQTALNEMKLTIIHAVQVSIGDQWRGDDVCAPFSRLYYMKSGGGKITYGNSEIFLDPNHVYLVPIGLKLSHFPTVGMEKLYFHFNIAKGDGYDLLNGLDRITSLECTKEYIKEMYELFNSPRLSDAFIMKANIWEDISKLVESEKKYISEYTPYSPKIYDAIRIINENPTIRIKTADISKQLFVSESYLSKTFKKEVGITIGDYIDKTVMQNAQIALIYRNESISAISERFGFNDRYYFSKRFKLLFGLTPSQYRNKTKRYYG